LPSGFPQIVDITKQLGLQEVGLYTPWAARESSTTWEPVQQPPDTNIAVFALNDQLLAGAHTLTFGQPIPFVAILTEQPVLPEQVSAALKGTAYKFYQTQAVYRQTDSAPTPKIVFLHWAESRPPGDVDKGVGSLTQAAASVGGKLTYAIQVNYQSTALRQPPAVPFLSALQAQMGTPPGGSSTVPPSTSIPAKVKGKQSLVGPILVGAGVAVVTFLTARSLQETRGRR
jgi:hypothetical protein